MTSIPDSKLFKHGHRLKDKVVVITGAANGIGKETAKRFASYGAKVVIGDIDIVGAQKLVEAIESLGGEAVSMRCNVTTWDDQVSMFDLAMSKYGAVDIVVPYAGVSELGLFETLVFKDGKPVKPDTRTIEVNLLGVLYTTHLALHYLTINRVPDSLKALVLIGSMASWARIPRASLYASSKHAILGLMRSIYPTLTYYGIRIACIHPSFVDTDVVPVAAKLFFAGIPLANDARIAGAIIYSATDPDPTTSGCAWLLTDDGPVFMIPKEEFKFGVYRMIDERANALVKGVTGVAYYARLVGDLSRIIRQPLLIAGLGLGAAKILWKYRRTISEYVHRML